MKTNLKYQNGTLPKQPKKKDLRTSLGWCALTVLGIFLACSIIFTPASASLRDRYDLMTTDVEFNGTVSHKLTMIGSQVLFYISSLLSTAAFFVGASYIVNFAVARQRNKALGASAITFIGLNLGTLLTLGAYVIIKIGSPKVSLPDSFIETVLFEGLFHLICVGAVTALTHLLVSKRAPLYLYAMCSCTVMFLSAAGLELFENVPFFLNGTVLTEDVVKMILSMLLYVLHAFIGFVIMLRMMRRPHKA